MTSPRVSVCVVTYAHERFLGEALRSILAQDYTDFEVVVGVDLCDDRTVEVARSFAASDPRVRVLEPEAERLRGRKNFLRTFGAARGEFVAWCDGDDGWTSPEKLRRQIEFLDAHPECSACFHATHEVDADGRPLRGLCEPFGKLQRYGPGELALDNPAHSCSVVYRRALLSPFPAWLSDTPTADWPVLAHLSARGPIGYLPYDWAFHREQAGGVWSGLDEERRDDVRKRTRDALAEHVLGSAYAERIAEGRDRDLMRLARARERRGDRAGALAVFAELRTRGAPGRTVPALRFWRRFVRVRWLRNSARAPVA